jgi:hypothetical protein
VIDHIALAHQAIHDRRVANVLNGEAKADPLLKRRDVLKATCAEIIDHGHFVAAIQQLLSQMAADETCTASDQRACWHVQERPLCSQRNCTAI